MTGEDRTVQVPVSLIKQAERFDRRGGLGAEVHAWLGELSALLPQPTPTAEPCRIKRGLVTEEVYCAVHGRAAGWPCKVTAEPPRIEDMAPGTLLRRIIDTAVQARPSYLRSDIIRLVKDIDPSTIRDVTPPKASEK